MKINEYNNVGIEINIGYERGEMVFANGKTYCTKCKQIISGVSGSSIENIEQLLSLLEQSLKKNKTEKCPYCKESFKGELND